jgi:transmembrane sensor
MANIRQEIDFQIIWKKVNTIVLSETEEQQLITWLKQDQEHQAYFDWVVLHHSGKGMPLITPNTKLGWEDFNRRTGHQKKRILTYLSGVAAIIIFGVGMNWFFSESHRDDIQTVSKVEPIPPGSKKAVLIGEDGVSYDLTNSNLSDELSNANLKMEEGSISYRNALPSDQLVYHTLKIPRGGEYYVVLSDNSKVWLNSESTLKYPVSFGSGSREIELEGEAYFEVTKDKKRPFRVVTGNQTVQVLGTSFNVSSYSKETIYTTLVEGEVEVYKTLNLASNTLLTPEYQSVFSRNTGSIEKKKVNVREFTAWKDGNFLFIDQPLDKMLETLSRWYDVEILYLNEKVKTVRFTGSIKRYEDFNKVLKMIAKTNEVTFEIEDNKVKVK